MSLIGDLIDGVMEGTGWATGVAIVVGVAALGSRRDSPLMKNLTQGYQTLTDRARELMAEAGEQLQDLYAEARAEYDAGVPATSGAAAMAAAPRRRGRPPRAAAAAAPGTAAETQPAPPRRRGRPPRAEGAATTEAAGAPAARRPRRPRTGNAAPGAA